MKYLPLVLAELWRKPLRTTFTTLALVVAFVLFGLLRGINAGFDILIANSRMDRLYVGTRYGAPLPMADKAQIAQMPGVKAVTAQAYMGGTVGGDPKRQFFVGLCDDGFFDFFSQFNATPAQVAEMRGKRTAFIISRTSANDWGFKVGDRVTMKSPIAKKDGRTEWEFDLVAIVDSQTTPFGISVGNLEYLNEERAAGKDMADQFLVIMSDPNLSVGTAKAIDDRYLNSGAPTFSVVERLIRENNQGDNSVVTMVNAIVLSTLFALLLMTSNSMMQSFRERVPEFGTLKTLGFSDRQVLGLVLAEAVIQCLVGAAVGLTIARLLVPYVKKLLSGPAVLMAVPWSLVGLGLVVAFLVALVSAAVPAWRASRMQIVDALAAR
jgi:putative ABC transport system permease protein